MKVIYDTDLDEELIDAGISPLDDDDLMLCNLDGYAGLQGIGLGVYSLSWDNIDRLKVAIAKAEEMWR